MKPELLSFDAAGTLIRVDWAPGRFAVECALECGVSIDKQIGQETYDRLLHTRWQEYCSINQSRDDNACDQFWQDLGEDWLKKFEYAETHSHHLVKVAHSRLYGPDQQAFTLYDDVISTLEEFKRKGFRMVILSNWDYSLHRIVRNLGIERYFEHVFASLQEGPEKPDPALFKILCDRTGVEAANVAHIGDNPLDDVEGARNAGMKPIFLDRSLAVSKLPTISTLHDLGKALECLS